MKFRYWLSILLIFVVVIIVVTSCASSTATPPIFLNAQKGFRPQPLKRPLLGKAPAPGKNFGPKCEAWDAYCVYAGVPQIMCKALNCVRPPRNGDPCNYTDKKNKYSENCVKAEAPEPNVGPKCEQGDTDCVYAGLPPPTGRCRIADCIERSNGDPCRYPNKNCIKAPQPVGGGGDKPPDCVDTSAEKCDPSQQCVHYTCKTPEDAKRLKVKLDKNEMNFKCDGKTDTHVFNCKTVGNTTFCGCGWMRPEDNGGKCPDGMVVKTWRGSSSCSPRLEHTTLLNGKHGACTKDLRQYSFCAMPPQPQADGTGFENCVVTRFDDNCKSNAPCVHYTCKTAGDAQRINIDNVNIKCGESGERG